MKYYAIGETPVTVLKKRTYLVEGKKRRRFWLCRLPEGTEKWVLYRDLVRVTVNGERGRNGGSDGWPF